MQFRNFQDLSSFNPKKGAKRTQILEQRRGGEAPLRGKGGNPSPLPWLLATPPRTTRKGLGRTRLSGIC